MQINWPKAPSLRVAVSVPDPPHTQDVALQDWMKLAKQAIDTLANGNAEMQEFLDDLLDAVRPVQLIGNDIEILAGEATPEGAIAANVGSLFLRTDGGASTTMYIKETGTGNTGWRVV